MASPGTRSASSTATRRRRRGPIRPTRPRAAGPRSMTAPMPSWSSSRRAAPMVTPTSRSSRASSEWERLACYGDRSITLEGVLGCGGCGGAVPGIFEPEWLASPMNYDLLSVDPSEHLGPFMTYWSPDGPERPDAGSIVRITGHFDDPAAEGCRVAARRSGADGHRPGGRGAVLPVALRRSRASRCSARTRTSRSARAWRTRPEREPSPSLGAALAHGLDVLRQGSRSCSARRPDLRHLAETAWTTVLKRRKSVTSVAGSASQRRHLPPSI